MENPKTDDKVTVWDILLLVGIALYFWLRFPEKIALIADCIRHLAQ